MCGCVEGHSAHKPVSFLAFAFLALKWPLSILSFFRACILTGAVARLSADMASDGDMMKGWTPATDLCRAAAMLDHVSLLLSLV